MKVGVITGGHSFDVIGFHRLFRSLDGMDCYIQSLENWASDYGQYGHRYDALVFYTMHTPLPQDCPGGKRTRAAIDALGEGPGVVILHHGILGFKQDAQWDEMVGLADRTLDGYSHDERLKIRVENPDHPITEGLCDWEMVDETYDFKSVEDDGNEVLLTVDHPESMRTMAWTRRYRQAKVFNYVFGHDDQTWSNEHFRMVLERGIRWASQSGECKMKNGGEG